MEFTKTPYPLLAVWLSLVLLLTGGPFAIAQSVSEAEEEAESARRAAMAADGLVDEAVANRSAIEAMLIESITRLNELSARLSEVGSALDAIGARLGFADVELAGIQTEIETRAVESYMTALSSPTVAWVSTGTVEHAMVASSVVEDIVAAGQSEVDHLVVKRRSLMTLQGQYQAKQEEFTLLKAAMDAEVERFAALYEEADQEVAEAVRQAEAADAAYRSALSAVEVAQAKERERQRQEERSAPVSPPTTAPSPQPTSSGGGGPWDHPPAVERWRTMVEQFFPSHRVEEALRIIDCESNGDPDAYNPYSGASGLFQFIPSTWATTSPRAGYPGASAFDPEANIASAAWLANEYQQQGQYYWQPWNCKRVLN